MIALLSFALSLYSLGPSAHATLSLEQYLVQVRTGNLSYQASENSRESGELRKKEGDIITAWTLYGSATVVNDYKLPQSAATPYTSVWNQTYSLGVSKQWGFGLLSKLSYNWSGTSFVGAVTQTFGAITIGALNSFNTYPMLELSLPLVANGLGSTVRANQTLTEAGALASQFAASFQNKALASSAEATYWRLSVARRLQTISRETLARTQKINDWNTRRVRMQLGDRADALQSAAGLQQARLAVQSAEDEVRNASRAFNSARNSDAQEVTEELDAFDAAVIDHLSIPVRAEKRDDVKAAEQSMRISQANAKIAMQRALPSVDVFSSLALNGQPPGSAINYPQSFSESMSYSFTANHPTYTVGVRANIPLHFGTMNDAYTGYVKEQTAADLNFQRKFFEQEQTWQELNQNFVQSKKKLAIARELESIQQEKLEHERVRYDRGRTTTFQLLSFENDYLTSQLQRIRSEFEVIAVVAQLKLFAEEQSAQEQTQAQ